MASIISHLFHLALVCLVFQCVSALWWKESGCKKNSECSTDWCEGGSIFTRGSCKSKRSDGENCYGSWGDSNSCIAGQCTCSRCGKYLPSGSKCANKPMDVDTDCKSGWCDGNLGFTCSGTCRDKKFDKESCDGSNGQCRGGICENGVCKGEDVVELLARCALDVYSFSNEGFSGRLVREYKQEQKFGVNGIQFGVYKILSGERKGKRIMAFRGTNSGLDVVSDIGIGSWLGMAVTRELIKYVKERTSDQNPDYVTGHSLGGFYAEIASATYGKPGAAFNAPGPNKVIKSRSFMPENPKFKVGFGVHLTHKDAVSYVGNFLGVAASHVSEPVWHTVNSNHPLTLHSMAEMLRHFTYGICTPRAGDIDFDCWSACGGKGGKCESACGSGGHCCRAGHIDCPDDLNRYGHTKYHTCVICK